MADDLAESIVRGLMSRRKRHALHSVRQDYGKIVYVCEGEAR
jgi:hypothetical protein